MKKIDRDAYYHETNEWVRKDEELYVIGITDFAQTVFGNVVLVDLPEVGKYIQKDKVLLVIESDKVETEIMSPLSGEVISVNQGLINNPNYLNEYPYEKGWLLKIKIADEKELLGLMNADAYVKYMSVFYNKNDS